MADRGITAELARILLDYDQSTGIFRWKARARTHFSSDREFNRWNTRYAGVVAGSPHFSGYIDIGILNQLYRAHHLAWLIVTGAWPFDQIDHINGVRSDNRWSNLRIVTHAENGRNQRIGTRNKSGKIGVEWHTATRKWKARIMAHGKRIELGYFDNLDDAIAARTAAEIANGYHPNHGDAKRPIYRR